MNKSPNKDIAVSVDGLSKTFRIPLEGSTGLKQKLINTLKGRKGYREFTPLNDISFQIEKGEFFGIVGRNGSGKSTLLKTIAGIYTANKGGVTVNGSLVPFIELGVGFNPELTGRENVFLNGSLLGFSKKEMDEMYDQIVEFAELSEFMDERLKNYSSGMQVRLAFSIAIRAESDILLLDEVLAVGDEAFQRKCFSYFAQLKKDKKTVILVTHDMSSVQRFCTRALLINDGSILNIGNTADIARDYQKLNSPVETIVEQASKVEKPKQKKTNIKISGSVVDEKGKSIRYVKPDKNVVIKLSIESKVLVESAFVGILINKENGEMVYRYTSEKPNQTIDSFKAGSITQLTVELENIFGEGEYSVTAMVKSNDRATEYVIEDDLIQFGITSGGDFGWLLQPGQKINIEQSETRRN